MIKLIKLTIVTSVCLYFIGQVLAHSAEPLCKGWDCAEVYCPDGYAVKLPDGKYLPCEHFSKYIDGDKSVLR